MLSIRDEEIEELINAAIPSDDSDVDADEDALDDESMISNIDKVLEIMRRDEEKVSEVRFSPNHEEHNIEPTPQTAVSEQSVPSTSNISTFEKPRIPNLNVKWRKIEYEPPDSEWRDELLPPTNEKLTPYEIFKYFIPDEIIDQICEQSNLYAFQKDQVTPNFTAKEVEQYFGILLYTGIYSLPSYRMYWKEQCRLSIVADVMSRNRFDLFRKYFHIVDNSKINEKKDKLFKVRPLIESLREKLLSLPAEEYQSIDEQMIPFKGRSHMKQYVKGKPHKWGYKVFTRASSSGIMHDFLIYCGKDTCDDFGLGVSGNVVLQLSEDIPEHRNYNFFLTIGSVH